MSEKYLTFTQTAQMLGKSRATIYRLLKEGKLTPHYKAKSPVSPFFRESEVKALDLPKKREPLTDQKLHTAAKSRDGFRCVICFGNSSIVAHHRVPVIKGGEDSLENLVTLCTLCHGGIHSVPERLVEKATKLKTLSILNWLIEGIS